jgi:AraC-like DNA-binding protein
MDVRRRIEVVEGERSVPVTPLPPLLSSASIAWNGGGMPSARLNRVVEYIAANLHDGLSLSVLASVGGMNLYYFARLFKQSMGVSPHRYVLTRRIRRAEQFLRKSNMTVLEVSLSTGFADQSHFTKVFRHLVGVSATEYRAQAGYETTDSAEPERELTADPSKPQTKHP